jgi:ribosome-binding factor A
MTAGRCQTLFFRGLGHLRVPAVESILLPDRSDRFQRKPPEKTMSKKHSGRSSLRDFGSDSFPPAGHSRKDLQLCSQVADTLQLALGDCGDDVLRDLHVVRVVPAPDASQLLVIVGSAPGELPPPPTDVLAHLQARTPWLRGEVAHAITRKRAPSLLFEYLATAPGEGGEAPR